MQTFDVVVVGAGAVGAGLALALAGADARVALVEPQPPRPLPDENSWDSRVYALSPGNVEWLEALGVWARVPSHRVSRVEAMRIYGDREPGRLEFSAYDAGLRELAWIVENRLLQHALWETLAGAAHVTRFCPARCASVEWLAEGAVIELEGGERLDAKLVVGADSADSWVREQAGIAVRVHDYHELGVVANFAAERPHSEAAFQWFRSDGVLALLPLPGNRVSMVWSAPEAHARELLAADARTLARKVEEASAGALGALEPITPAASFALKRQRAACLVKPRVALTGDAAHVVHPLAGQGMNLGLRDARELAAVIGSRGPRRDCGDLSLLRRFERARAEDIAALEAATDGLEKLFGAQAVWLSHLRNLGLALVDTQPALKSLLVRHAAA